MKQAAAELREEAGLPPAAASIAAEQKEVELVRRIDSCSTASRQCRSASSRAWTLPSCALLRACRWDEPRVRCWRITSLVTAISWCPLCSIDAGRCFVPHPHLVSLTQPLTGPTWQRRANPPGLTSIGHQCRSSQRLALRGCRSWRRWASRVTGRSAHCTARAPTAWSRRSIGWSSTAKTLMWTHRFSSPKCVSLPSAEVGGACYSGLQSAHELRGAAAVLEAMLSSTQRIRHVVITLCSMLDLHCRQNLRLASRRHAMLAVCRRRRSRSSAQRRRGWLRRIFYGRRRPSGRYAPSQATHGLCHNHAICVQVSFRRHARTT